MKTRIAGAFLVSCELAAACGSQHSDAAARRADPSAHRDSVAATAAASMDEGNVLALLINTHMADSALGALGAAMGSSTDVKEFGRMILREHRALAKDAAQLGRAQGISPEAPRVPPDEPSGAQRANMMSAARGPQWDRAYLDYAVAVHESAMENTARALAASQRPDVKRLVHKSVPILQKHIDKARSLRKSMTAQRDSTNSKTKR